MSSANKVVDNSPDRVAQLLSRLVESDWQVEVSRDHSAGTTIKTGLSLGDLIKRLEYRGTGQYNQSVTQWVATLYEELRSLVTITSRHRDEASAGVERLYLKLDRLEIKLSRQLRIANLIAYQSFRVQYPDAVAELDRLIQSSDANLDS